MSTSAGILMALIISMLRRFLVLTAVIDLYRRDMLSWPLSNTLETRFCLEALDEPLVRGRPENLLHRPGPAVHVAGVHQPAGGGRRRGKPRRLRPGTGQCVRRTPLAEREVRRRLHQALRAGPRPGGGADVLLPVLRRGESPPIAKLPHSGRGLLLGTQPSESWGRLRTNRGPGLSSSRGPIHPDDSSSCDCETWEPM